MKPWKSKDKANSRIRSPVDNQPGECTSMDAMTSTSPGLIPQMSGFLTKRKFSAATIFVDHASSYGYVFLQENQTLETTLEAKASYERHASTFGIRIKSYHADNGRFADAKFHKIINNCNQQLTFCGVGAHHQNGIVERRIRTLTDSTRTLLAHTLHQWPKSLINKCVSPTLWPFALKYVNEKYNTYTFDKFGLSPLMKFSRTKTDFLYTKDEHTFGCPAFVLNSDLQVGNKIPKWDNRVRVGIYLGKLPHHAGSVGMILNLETGHISPQYHVLYDDDFTTVSDLAKGNAPSNWEFLCKANATINSFENTSTNDTWIFQNKNDENGYLLSHNQLLDPSSIDCNRIFPSSKNSTPPDKISTPK